MGAQVTALQILKAGGVTLGVLIVLSIISLAVLWERWSFYRRSTRGLEGFLFKLRQNVARGDMGEALAVCRQHKGPAAEVVMAALVGPPEKEERQRATTRSLERQLSDFHRGLGWLGTVGSTAPFIGLFGTVLGVMRAFRDLAGAAGTGPGVVALGISEALVATAAGLAVAIPAIMGYNYFSARAARLADELRWVTDEILDRLTERPSR